MDASAITTVASALGVAAVVWGLLRSFRREMRASITERKADRTELKADIAELRTELKTDIKTLDDRVVSLIEDIGKIDSRVQRIEGYLIGRKGEPFRTADDEPITARQT